MSPTEYLRFLEFLKLGKNDAVYLPKNELQKTIDREISSLPKIAPLVERYKNSIMSFHVHGLLRFGVNGSAKGRKRGGRIDFCATIQSRVASAGKPIGVSNTLMLPDTGTDKIQASVLVDIRQVSEKTQRIIDNSQPVVRLHTLNECKRRIGNPREIPGEIAFCKRGRAFLRKPSSQRKLAIFLPLGINGGNVRISLDEVEYQMIQGRTHLINHFASQERNFNRRRLGNVQLLFALRFFDDEVRLTSSVRGEASLDRAELFFCPDQFSFRRL